MTWFTSPRADSASSSLICARRGALSLRRWAGAAVLLATCIAIGRPGAAQCPSEWLPGGGFDTFFRQPLPGWPNLANVSGLKVLSNGGLLATGDFGSVGGLPANNVAVWDGATWTPLLDGVTYWNYVRGQAVLASGDLVVCGEAVLPTYSSQVARWTGSAWAPLGTGMGGTYPYISALCALPNGDLVAGGTFTTAGGAPASNVARWNGSSWSALGTGMGGASPSGVTGVSALARLPNGDLIAGGLFTTAGGVPANQIARWNGTTWSPLGAGLGFPGEVRSLVVLPNGDLVAAGTFNSAGGVLVDNIARWDGSTWSPLGLGTDNTISALAVMPNGDLVAAGSFYNAGGAPALHLARWDGSNWAEVSTGYLDVNGTVGPLEVLADGTLVVGGHDILWGGGSHPGAQSIARWGCRSGIAEAFPIGYGCGGQASSFYENFTVPPAAFDLSNSKIRMTLTGSGYSVDHLPGAPTLFPTSSADLALGDEDISPLITLPFTLPYQGGTTSQIMVASNGYVFLQQDWNTAYFYGDPSQLLQGAVRLAPLWSDLDPAAGSGGGTVHVDIDVVNQVVYATWLNVQEWNAPMTASTFQVAMFADGTIEYRYLNCAMSAAPVLVGWSPGNGALDPYSRDISAVPHFSTSTLPHAFPLTQTSTRPGLGTTVTLTTTQVPANSLLGLTIFGFTSYQPGIDLGVIGMPGCLAFVSLDVLIPFFPSAGAGSETISIPSNPSLIGVHLYSQGAAWSAGVNAYGMLTSNALDLRIGTM